MLKQQTIITYYDTSEIDYRLVWNLDRSLAMHYGYWDKSTKNLSDALAKENQVLAKMARVKKTDRVLDAGCGVGGSSIYLAQTIGCNVTGITLSQKQVETATRNASNHRVSATTQFLVRDYTKTDFPNESFDVIWAIESVIYAEDKEKFLKESYRLLKGGGRLIIADFFATQETLRTDEKQLTQTWLHGWGGGVMATGKQFVILGKRVGFHTNEFSSITDHIRPSAKRLYLAFFPGLIVGKILEWTGFRTKMQTEHVWTTYYQYQALKKNIWEYGIFFAEK